MKEIKVKVPEGITEFSVNINGEIATVVYETRVEENGKNEEWQPKDGEIVFAESRGRNQHFIFPFGHIKEASMDDISFGWDLSIDMISEWNCDVTRPATEEEKRLLADALDKMGKRWNEEKKCIEDLPR